MLAKTEQMENQYTDKQYRKPNKIKIKIHLKSCPHFMIEQDYNYYTNLKYFAEWNRDIF